MLTDEIYNQTKLAIGELLNAERDGLRPVKLLVIGGSSSEIAGGVIGHNSTYELGEAVSRAALEMATECGFDVAFQCCEHLNRALAMEREAAEAAEKEKESRLQNAMLKIQQKHGKNAILHGTSYLEDATGRERNKTVGGHRR